MSSSNFYTNRLNADIENIEVAYNDLSAVSMADQQSVGPETVIGQGNTSFEMAEDEDVASAADAEEQAIGQLLWGGAIGISLLMVGAFVLARCVGPFAADAEKAELLWGVAGAAVIPAIGLWISALTHAFASATGSYVVATGAILFGGINLLRRITNLVSNWRQLGRRSRIEWLIQHHRVAIFDRYFGMDREAFVADISRRFNVRPSVSESLHDLIAAYLDERSYSTQYRGVHQEPVVTQAVPYSP